MNANFSQDPKVPLSPEPPTPRRCDEVADSLHFLDNLKGLVLEHLTRIESLARLAAIELETDPSHVEDSLKERLLVLEASQARLVAAAARRDLEWREFLEDLNHDRNRLAQAWQDLEHERLRSSNPARADPSPRTPPAVTQDIGVNPSEPAGDPRATDLISQEILRQFRTLQGDVRRNIKP